MSTSFRSPLCLSKLPSWPPSLNPLCLPRSRLHPGTASRCPPRRLPHCWCSGRFYPQKGERCQAGRLRRSSSESQSFTSAWWPHTSRCPVWVHSPISQTRGLRALNCVRPSLGYWVAEVGMMGSLARGRQRAHPLPSLRGRGHSAGACGREQVSGARQAPPADTDSWHRQSEHASRQKLGVA